MITFVEGSFTYSLLLGMLAAVNPCGFVLLPTYLVAYLSVSDDTDVATRLRRSLVVGGSVSAGFLVVFLIVGAISRLFTNWIEINAKYASLVVGLALIVMGIRMLSGWRPRIWVPALGGESRRNGVVGMFAFGVVYAIASIGCTIGLLTTAILGSFTRDGLVSGVLSVVMYGFGMALFVTALTTTLAFAKTALVRGGRGVMSVVSYVSSGLVLITGIYLAWYWYVAITEQSDQGDILRALGNWQTTIVNRISDIGALPVAVACGIVVALAWFAARRRTSFSDS
ncbi:MAG: cytochrome c biogenesis CcdA family protein [Ilumatobacteraceae bacterium]